MRLKNDSIQKMGKIYIKVDHQYNKKSPSKIDAREQKAIELLFKSQDKKRTQQKQITTVIPNSLKRGISSRHFSKRATIPPTLIEKDFPQSPFIVSKIPPMIPNRPNPTSRDERLKLALQFPTVAHPTTASQPKASPPKKKTFHYETIDPSLFTVKNHFFPIKKKSILLARAITQN
jgi:hypothetical protein